MIRGQPSSLMKYYLLLISLLIHKLCIAQYYPEHSIRIIDTGYAPVGADYLQPVDIGKTYYNPNQHLEELRMNMKKVGGNVARIITTEYTEKKKKHIATIAEIFKAANPEDVKVVSEQQYTDSLKYALLNDPAKESMIIIFSSPTVYINQRESIYIDFETTSNSVTEGCFLNKNAGICSYITEEEILIHIRIDSKRYYTLDMKPGRVYFVEYDGGSINNAFKPVHFLYGYRTCRSYQKYNTQKHN